MSLKSATLLVLIAIAVLTVWEVVHFISTLLGVIRDLIPPIALLSALIYLFAAVCALVFFFVFYRSQPTR